MLFLSFSNLGTVDQIVYKAVRQYA